MNDLRIKNLGQTELLDLQKEGRVLNVILSAVRKSKVECGYSTFGV